MQEITLEQANDASKLLERYVEQEKKKIAAICNELRLFSHFKKVHEFNGLEDIEGLTVFAYNGLKTYVQKNLNGISEKEAIFRISREGLLKTRKVGKKTLLNIEEVFGLYGIQLLP